MRRKGEEEGCAGTPLSLSLSPDGLDNRRRESHGKTTEKEKQTRRGEEKPRRNGTKGEEIKGREMRAG